MSKSILGLDLGTNSVGWALFSCDSDNNPTELKDLGVRIFQRSVEDKTPTPKNQARRNARLARRVNQRRAGRKQRMQNYLISLGMLPQELLTSTAPEAILNEIGDPYQLRAEALDKPLPPHALGRILLHLVQRRGFQSNRKTLLGDMIDDPDALQILVESGEEHSKEELTEFKKDIDQLRQNISENDCRTLGEFLYGLPKHHVKRNRAREGGKLKTDRQMYKDEFWQIIDNQTSANPVLETVKENLFEIIFFQRPLKLKKDRVGKCSIEKSKYRAKKAWRLYQRFRYLQDINNLQYFEGQTSTWETISDSGREKLVALFEADRKPTITKIKKTLGLSARGDQLNFETGSKQFKGNLTTIAIREEFPDWDKLSSLEQDTLEQDLITYESKSALKRRLTKHWGIDDTIAVKLCVLEFEPEHSSHSLKAINKLLPFLESGLIYSDARVAAGYHYEPIEVKARDLLGTPPEIPNPIVSRGLHEIKRVVNAIIKQHGKPTSIRIEMARDLEMNTKRYSAHQKQQRANEKLNLEAQKHYESVAAANPQVFGSKYASHSDRLKYRLWKEQNMLCAYSLKAISQTQLFTSEIEIDHIVPYSRSLNDSYMNKVICFGSKNQFKGQRTPIEAFGADSDNWESIEQAIRSWYKNLSGKRDAFYKTTDSLDKDFISSQLSDTRYISKEALHYLETLGVDISTVKGQVTSWLRHIWGMNSLVEDSSRQKDRSDHRHHAIDAAVIACIDRTLYKTMVRLAKDLEQSPGSLHVKDLHLDPRFSKFREQVKSRIHSMYVSHAPQRKVGGALHEETGIGFVKGVGTIEAQAAKRYWKLLYGKSFSRNRDLEGTNAQLNYGYAVIRAMIARALVGTGFHPAIGINHQNQYNAYCLADDIMEPFRPWVDQRVLELNKNSNFEVNKETKTDLLNLLSEQVLWNGEKTPLMVSVSLLCARLKAAYQDPSIKLIYPLRFSAVA